MLPCYRCWPPLAAAPASRTSTRPLQAPASWPPTSRPTRDVRRDQFGIPVRQRTESKHTDIKSPILRALLDSMDSIEGETSQDMDFVRKGIRDNDAAVDRALREKWVNIRRANTRPYVPGILLHGHPPEIVCPPEVKRSPVTSDQRAASPHSALPPAAPSPAAPTPVPAPLPPD
jgi:hypothetical protein